MAHRHRRGSAPGGLHRLRTSRRRSEPRRRCWRKSTAAGDGAAMDHPHSRQAELAASRAALRVEDDGGFQRLGVANLKLQRKEFATSFGRGSARRRRNPGTPI